MLLAESVFFSKPFDRVDQVASGLSIMILIHKIIAQGAAKLLKVRD